MKLKTSCYDPATGRMELRRFAPVWILYAISLLLLTGFGAADLNNQWADYQFPEVVENLIRYMSLYNMVYAFLLAQLLFGDLYSPRVSYALHALPIPRSGWFGTQIILGLMGSLIPNVLNAFCLLTLADGWRITVLWWLAASELQFLFFFGLAVLCAVCAGNRFGMLTLYGMGNFIGLPLFWFRENLYKPLIFGMVHNRSDLFLTPINNMRFHAYFYIQTGKELVDGTEMRYRRIVESVQLYDQFWETIVWAAVGIALIWLAMRLYRKRRPECAGDLLAFQGMVPVYLVLFTLDAGMVGHLAAYIIKWELGYPMLVLGLVLGYFACQMLLRRTVNVFSWKNLLPLAGICSVFLLTVVLTGLDIFGLVERLPDEAQIDYISINSEHNRGYDYRADTPERIAEAMQIQREAIDEYRVRERSRPLTERIFGDESREVEFLDDEGNAERAGFVEFRYVMKDGSYRARRYPYHTTSASTPKLQRIFSSPSVLFADVLFVDRQDEVTVELPSDIPMEHILEKCGLIGLECDHHETAYELGRYSSELTYISDKEEMAELIKAIYADSEAGVLAQTWFVRSGNYCPDYLSLNYPSADGRYHRETNLTLSSDCTNIYNWLAEHGYHELPSESEE